MDEVDQQEERRAAQAEFDARAREVREANARLKPPATECEDCGDPLTPFRQFSYCVRCVECQTQFERQARSFKKKGS